MSSEFTTLYRNQLTIGGSFLAVIVIGASFMTFTRYQREQQAYSDIERLQDDLSRQKKMYLEIEEWEKGGKNEEVELKLAPLEALIPASHSQSELSVQEEVLLFREKLGLLLYKDDKNQVTAPVPLGNEFPHIKYRDVTMSCVCKVEKITEVLSSIIENSGRLVTITRVEIQRENDVPLVKLEVAFQVYEKEG